MLRKIIIDNKKLLEKIFCKSIALASVNIFDDIHKYLKMDKGLVKTINDDELSLFNTNSETLITLMKSIYLSEGWDCLKNLLYTDEQCEKKLLNYFLTNNIFKNTCNLVVLDMNDSVNYRNNINNIWYYAANRTSTLSLTIVDSNIINAVPEKNKKILLYFKHLTFNKDAMSLINGYRDVFASLSTRFVFFFPYENKDTHTIYQYMPDLLSRTDNYIFGKIQFPKI